MSKVLTTDSSVKCSHTGGVQLGPGTPKLKVQGKSVLMKLDIEGRSVDATCTNKPPPDKTPCTLVVTVKSGLATKLSVQGESLLLDTTNGETNSTPVLGTLQVTETQTKLTAK